MLGGLLAFVGLAAGIETLFSLDTPVHLGPVTSLLIASIPALLWLSFFYFQDRYEQEPTGHIAGSYIAGALVAGPCAGFIIELASPAFSPIVSFSVLAPQRWVYAIAIVGIAQEVSKYIVVRYSLYLSPEFDEPIDGIVYMSAAGIGFASYSNYHFLQSMGGDIYLSAGAARVVVTTLAHASFAAVTGFALGYAKFSVRKHPRRRVTLLAGLLVAALLNGCFQMIMDALSVQGLATSPWRRVFFSFGFAAGIFLLVAILMRRLLVAPRSPLEEAHADPS